MNNKEKILAFGSFVKPLIDLFLAISFIALLSIPSARADETQAPKATTDPAQPTVAATGTYEPEKATPQALNAESSGDSIDFLMERSPLTPGVSGDVTPEIPVPKTPAPPVKLEILQGTVLKESDEVAMLVSEKCSQNGNTAEGTSSCERVYSNGHHARVLTQNANEGDELKHQTVIEEFDGDNTLLFKKTIRHRLDYNYLNDRKAKEKELFDITYQPAGKKATRELTVYEYFLDTGKTRALSWTQYQQTGDKPKAELVYHASLRYGDDGSPDRGLAEQWRRGERTETFMNWSRRSKGFATLDDEAWRQWEGWILNVSMQAYLP